MLKLGAHSYSKIAIAGIVCISLILIYFFRWSGGLYRFVISGDGNDYYSYLISIFIDKNLTHQDLSHWYVMQTPTGTINAHPPGVSVLLFPFFLIGYVWAALFNAPLDGFSKPFQVMVSMGALFYLTAGLIYLRRLLTAFGIKDKIVALVIVLMFFGTNLIIYALDEPSMSHIYSFTLITAFLYYIHRIFQQPSKRHLYFAGIILGLIILVRPVNAIIFMVIPFFADSWDNLVIRIKKLFLQWKALVVPTILFLMVASIQSIIWLIQNGKVIQWSLRGRGFYFGRPQTWLMLFGFDSGFFIYTPLCLIILLGLIPLFRQNKFRFIILSLFIAFAFYLFSCYWSYNYYDGLGIRTFVDFYSLFSILLAILLTYLADKKIIKYAAIIFMGGAFLLNLVYCYQYQANIMLHSGMTYKKYKYIFLKTDKSYANVLGGSIDLEPYSTSPPPLIYNFSYKDTYSFNNNEYGVTAKLPLNFPTNELHLKINLKRKQESPNSSFNAYIVVQIESEKGEIKKYEAHRLNDTPAQTFGIWEDMHYEVNIISQASQPTDQLSVYIWNRDKKNFSIKEYSLEVYNYTY